MTTTFTPIHRSTLAWLPLALLGTLLTWGAVTGAGVVPGASATQVNVVGTVDAALYVDAAACPAAALDIGELVPGSDPWKTAQDVSGASCDVLFGTTNHLAGAALTMMEDSATAARGPAGALKCVGATCAGGALSDTAAADREPAAGTSAFGAQLLSASAGAAAQWSATPAVNPLTDAASTACTTAAPGDGRCAFTFGATAAATDAPGAYQAQARMVVVAR